MSIEDREVIGICNENHRRSNLARVVGYIVPVQEAEALAVSRAVEDRGSGPLSLALVAMALLVAVTLAVIVLA